jgi:Predicted acetyltransferase involved in intracellular survival and related acetyltransferases
VIRLSDKSAAEIAEMKLLWKENFGDSDEFIDFYFDKICVNNKIVVMREDGIITGMLHLNPYNFKKPGRELVRTYYVVGVMVREGYRNQGRMKKLFEYAYSVLSSERIRFVYLWPAKEDYYRGIGFKTVSQLAEIKIHRSDLPLLVDEMVTSKSDVEFGRLIGKMILPDYSAGDISSMVSEMMSESGSFHCLEKKGMLQGCYSIIRNGDTLEVDHMVPYFGLREYMGKLFVSIRETLERIDEEQSLDAADDQTEAAEMNAVSDDQTEVTEMEVEQDDSAESESTKNAADDITAIEMTGIDSDEDGSDIKYIKLTMDSRLVNCFRHTLDMNQVSMGRKYMVLELAESGIDFNNILFSEIV